MTKTYEIRDAIHGFIELNEWERDIINHPVFQRLRRIRQLSLTDMVYPGAMHNRFEHSLGVMHVATRMFDEIVKRRIDFLKSELHFNDAGLEKDRAIVRLSALLHDIGHAPFSHASEELMDKDSNGNPYEHEDYSAAAAVFLMKDVIESHPLNQNYEIKAQDIADFLNGSSKLSRRMLWRNLVSSQLDADRADYLLRDSHHTGVAYGNYDLNRLLVTLTVAIDPETESPVLAIEEGGEHAAEALIIARYMMFTQVYFQHTRRIYDYHAANTLKHLLKVDDTNEKGVLPPPTSKENVEEYLKWDDWRVLGMVQAGRGGEHGEILLNRKHHRCIFQTQEIPTREELEKAEQVFKKLETFKIFKDSAGSSWYKFGEKDIPILINPGRKDEKLKPLSQISPVVKGLQKIERFRYYIPVDMKTQAHKIMNQIIEN